MKSKGIFIILGTILVFGTNVLAQDRFEVYGEYSYLHFSPTITGVKAMDFNGGGGGAQLNFAKILAIKADFMGYGGITFSRTFNGSTYSATGNMFTYLFGPVVRIPIGPVKPFGELLFGGSSTNGYVNLDKVIGAGGTISQSQHPFTMAAGLGLDIGLSRHIAFRPGEFDYVLSRYTNPLTSTNNQNSFRYCGGFILKF